ncbi:MULTISPECIES: PSD1 and planctomycete cytochrome C domain-containing protein [unclassified Paraflavitalea]|uniref:PSD1 and planctomycete cytochrome C domain-containing protein n=1 Tax=unclassified Paraflavitalea TaxID=2798305 RepID=UPI003D33F9BA
MISKKLGVIACFTGMVLAASCFSSGNSPELPDQVSYNFHIRPIFSDKCFACHGPDAGHRKAGLRLDIADSAYAPLKETKGAFALKPGDPDASEVYLRVSSKDTTYQMPTPESHLGALTEYEVALVKKWIKQGARYEKHWAFIQPKKASPPDVSSDWVKNDIDKFIYQELDRRGLEPNEEADKERLLKRVSLDVTGLVPTPEETQAFVNDKSDNAYEKQVDRLLAQPQYGEKMAVYWMDLARYADSYGYQDDNVRTQWPWRDWVIHAFNSNMHYDQFLTYQIAGDMLPNATKEQQLATGFFRNHKYTEEGGVIDEEYRIEYLLDKTKTFGKGILGLTIECAQCHDHKYDPFSQKDYYQMLAFFNNTYEVGYEGDVSISKPAKNPLIKITQEDRNSLLKFINWKDTSALTVSVMGELKDSVRKTFTLKRGVYNLPDQEVQPQALPAVMKFDQKKFPSNRLGLAEWTVDKNNPLTARVFVNQIWQELFGRGIVKTVGDFGMQGELPSHPALLDWLAVDFMEHNWDVKYLIKQILMSATYRQSAKTTSEKQEKDPENIYLSHAPRVRVKAELVRDIVLSSSGMLVKEIGGPSVKPYQPKGLWEAATSGRGALASYRQDHGDALYRRGLYTFIKLTVPPPSMILFDASNRDQCEVKRSKTNTPLQALMMLNDPTVLEASRVLAQKIVSSGSDGEKAVENAFERIVCRKPSSKELQVLSSYYQDQLQQFTSKKLNAALTLKAGEYPQDPKLDQNKLAALMKTITTIYNLEETITKS